MGCASPWVVLGGRMYSACSIFAFRPAAPRASQESISHPKLTPTLANSPQSMLDGDPSPRRGHPQPDLCHLPVVAKASGSGTFLQGNVTQATALVQRKVLCCGSACE